MSEKKSDSEQNVKRHRILEVAGRMFMLQGYKAVSMDAIAEAAPVSKATLYNHFKDKKSLFHAVVAQRCQNWADALEKNLDTKQDPAKVLTSIATQFVELILSPDAIDMQRIIIGESKEFPELGKLFYDSGPKRSHVMMADYLEALDGAGKLSIDDPMMSANMFFNSLRGRHHMERLVGVKKSVSKQERDDLVAYIVGHFIKAHRS